MFLRKEGPGPSGLGFSISGRVGSGRVLDKRPGSGSGRVGVSKYTIGYFWVSLLFSGIFGYFRVCWVFSGISWFTHIYKGYFLTLMRAEKMQQNQIGYR